MARRRRRKLTRRNPMAATLSSPLYKPRRVAPAKGKGAYRRKPKHVKREDEV